MTLIDRQYLRTPFYGSRRMAAWLQTQGHMVNRKRVQRLMRLMGLETIYQRPRTSRPAPEHRRYPYLLRGLVIERVNQVWAADITYVPMARGFLYLVAVMDWVSRYVLAWRLSNLLDASFCIEALEEALNQGPPEIFNTDQGSQFTDDDFTSVLRAMASPSAWTVAAASATTSSSNGSGAASSMRRCICGRIKTWPRHGIGSPRTSISTTTSDCTRPWITAPRAKSSRKRHTLPSFGAGEKPLALITRQRHNEGMKPGQDLYLKIERSLVAIIGSTSNFLSPGIPSAKFGP